MLSILTPYGIGGTNRFMGMDHVSPGQEILQRGETSIQGTGLIAVQYRKTIMNQKLQNIDGRQQCRLQRVVLNNHLNAATRPPPEYSQIPDRPLCIPSLCDHKLLYWLRVLLLYYPASIASAAIPLRLETRDSSTAAFDAL